MEYYMTFLKKFFMLAIIGIFILSSQPLKAEDDDSPPEADIEEHVPTTIPLPISIDDTGINFSWDWFGFDHTKDFESSWSFAPIITGGGDRISYFIHLGKDKSITSIPLEYGNENDPYLVVETKGFEVSASIKPGGGFIGGLMFGGGLTPHIGTNVYTERVAANLTEAQNLPPISLLFPRKDTNLLREGDFLSYEIEGGVEFSVEPGYLGFSLGLVFGACGSWEVAIKKGKANIVTAKLSLNKLKTITGSIGLADSAFSALVLSGGKILANSKSFSFEYNLDIPLAAEAFENLLRGKLTLSNTQPEGVVALSKEETTTHGRFWDAQANIPFLAAAEIRETTGIVKSDSLDLGESITRKRVEGIMSFFIQTSSTNGILTRRMRKNKIFSATYLKIIPIGPEAKGIQDAYTGNLKWSYQRERMNKRKWENELNQLADLIGYPDKLKFTLPGKKLGMVKMEFDLEIPQIAIATMMNNFEKSTSQEIYQNALEKVLKNRCGENARGFLSRHKNFCIKSLQRAGSHSLEHLKKSLTTMLVYWKKREIEPFLKSFSGVGKLMTRDSFAYRTVLDLAGGEQNFCLGFKESGDRLNPVSVSLGGGKFCNKKK
jgi:hypothetical protein